MAKKVGELCTWCKHCLTKNGDGVCDKCRALYDSIEAQPEVALALLADHFGGLDQLVKEIHNVQQQPPYESRQSKQQRDYYAEQLRRAYHNQSNWFWDGKFPGA